MNEKKFIKLICKEMKRNLDNVNKCKNIGLFFQYENIHRGIALASLYTYGDKVYDIIIRMSNTFSKLAWENFL